MGKSKRLMELMMTVNRKRVFTAPELAREFGVSSRTIMRDLRELEELGVPLYAEVGPNGGYRVLNRRMLPPIAFTEDEAVALFFACHALRHYASLPFAAESSMALEKFYAYLPEDVRNRIDQLRNRFDLVTPQRQAKTPYLAELLQAAVEQNVVAIEYESKSGITKRHIQPIGVYAQSGLWYCPAYCFLRGGYRIFRCDRMRTVVQCPESEGESAAECPAPLDMRDVHLGNRLAFAKQALETVRLEAELSKAGVEQCETLPYLLPTLHLREDGSGWLDGEVAADDVSYLASVFVGLGRDATVKGPQLLIDEMRRLLQEMMAKYGGK